MSKYQFFFFFCPGWNHKYYKLYVEIWAVATTRIWRKLKAEQFWMLLAGQTSPERLFSYHTKNITQVRAHTPFSLNLLLNATLSCFLRNQNRWLQHKKYRCKHARDPLNACEKPDSFHVQMILLHIHRLKVQMNMEKNVYTNDRKQYISRAFAWLTSFIWVTFKVVTLREC